MFIKRNENATDYQQSMREYPLSSSPRSQAPSHAGLDSEDETQESKVGYQANIDEEFMKEEATEYDGRTPNHTSMG